MRTIATLVATSLVIGAATIAAPHAAEARFGAAIADAVSDRSIAQPAQYRTNQRATRRTYPPRTYVPPRPQYDTVSPYRYPGSRGALDSCSFC